MCATCGFPAAKGHWTEAGAVTSADRLQARQRRARLLRGMIDGMGLSAHDDGVTPGLTISTKTGRQEMVPDLAAAWAQVERLAGRPFDPLDPAVLDAAAATARADG